MDDKPDEVVKGPLDLIGLDGNVYLTVTGVNEFRVFDVGVPPANEILDDGCDTI